MPVAPTYPGVYVEEIPSGVRTITGVATSIAAFIGRAARGPTDVGDETLTSFADFERKFGGIWLQSTLGFAVRDFFQNGGSQAIVVRLFQGSFASDEERDAAITAATSVVTAASGAANVAAAKTAASAANTTIQDDDEASAAVKAAAAAVNTAVNGVSTTLDDVKAAARAALARATPADRYELSLGELTLVAAYPGAWGAGLRAVIDVKGVTDPTLFNLAVTDEGGGAAESYLNLSVDAASPRYVAKVLDGTSLLVRVKDDSKPNVSAIKTALDAASAAPTDSGLQDTLWQLTMDPVSLARATWQRAKAKRQQLPAGSADPDGLKAAEDAAKAALDAAIAAAALTASDGGPLTINNFLPADGELDKKGLFALEQADLFNLLCIPPYKATTETVDVDPNLVSVAASYCERRRAMLIVDAPKDWTSVDAARRKFTSTDDDAIGTRSRNAALFFPRLVRQNQLRDNRFEAFAACGAVAGVFARTDVQRGVWKAPAGTSATLVDAPALGAGGMGETPTRIVLTDAENGLLNPLGVNCLRALGPAGRVIWGSRTLAGNDQLADEYKYVPVRRLALFIEESLFRGLTWVVFEPNDEPLWAQIRLNVGAFMNNLFRQGAFQGSSPRDAYFVRCDTTTTTQNDINLGIVNIVVGFAPLKPAEFVILKLQQIAGQIQT
ncbi:MAG TPA: phage tail sheath C-terminal domain-containing protein [Polyangiaceae bacterium]|nr:phage tail sheath C-terminal domain-containing protein [Polyangiaceae bacterium]